MSKRQKIADVYVTVDVVIHAVRVNEKCIKVRCTMLSDDVTLSYYNKEFDAIGNSTVTIYKGDVLFCVCFTSNTSFKIDEKCQVRLKATVFCNHPSFAIVSKPLILIY